MPHSVAVTHLKGTDFRHLKRLKLGECTPLPRDLPKHLIHSDD